MCAEKNYPDNVYQFPTPEERPEDPRSRLFKRPERPEEKTDEPEVLKNIPDTQIIKKILIKKDGAEYMLSRKFELLPEERPTTFGMIREILKKTPDLLKKNIRNADIISAYIDFIVDDFKDNIPDNDLLSKAELYKYLGVLKDKLIGASALKRHSLEAEHDTAKYEITSQFHAVAGDLFKKLAAVEKDQSKKERLINECISEYLAQIQIYELKKKLSKEDFEFRIGHIAKDQEKIIAKNNLKQTLAGYDFKIKDLNKQILKLTKIK